ncbi:hypothetical protein RvY_11645 [Ramazzottius varieornatus]|uniref:Protein kinase domain-containing protein n=1 Tax=Ramazzottius varieornatus TaxID=947166 RepID=A0A1D1VPJ3_RAMVA|nr:hypothetical protein RvY_11645 [Ramazzottius varieornatus]
MERRSLSGTAPGNPLPLRTEYLVPKEVQLTCASLENYAEFFDVCGGAENGQLLVFSVREDPRQGSGIWARFMSARGQKAALFPLMSGDILVQMDSFPVSGLRLTEFKALFDYRIRNSYLYGTRTPDKRLRDEINDYFAEPVKFARRNSFDEALGYKLRTKDSEQLPDVVFITVMKDLLLMAEERPGVTFRSNMLQIVGSSLRGHVYFLDLRKDISFGTYGTVYFSFVERQCDIRHDSPRQKIEPGLAVKRLRRNGRDTEFEKMYENVDQLRLLKHPNLVDYHTIIVDADNQSWILMEYCEGSNLRRYQSLLGPKVHSRILTQVACGLEFLHQKRIVHGDLRCSTILLSGVNLKARICGLDTHHQLKPGQSTIKTASGKPFYMSPEMLHLAEFEQSDKSRPVNTATDIWSIECLLFKMILPDGSLPYEYLPGYPLDEQAEEPGQMHEILYRLKLCEGRMPWLSAISKFPKRLQTIITTCFEYDPAKRMSASQLYDSLIAWCTSKKFELMV